jgi:uncharacterized protein (DUF736 family)
MAYEQKDNTGSLFANTEKRSENFPDYSGSVRIEGADWWISGWRKTSKDGKTFLSLAVKRKDGTTARPDQAQEFKQAVKQRFPDADLSDEVPFSPEFR